MALEDQFVETDVQEIEAAHERIAGEFATTRRRRVIDWEEDFPDIDD